MSKRRFSVLVLCLFVRFTHHESTGLVQDNQTFAIPCEQKRDDYAFPSSGESYLQIHTDPFYREKGGTNEVCRVQLSVPDGKFLTMVISPFKPTTSCRDIGIWINIRCIRTKQSQDVQPCDDHTTYHSTNNAAMLSLYIGLLKQSFSITIAVRALDRSGNRKLNVSNLETLSGIVTPYCFDGLLDYAQYIRASFMLVPQPQYSVMLSFPHFHIKPTPGCIWSFLGLHNRRSRHTACWKHCGNLQLSPKLHAYDRELQLVFRTRNERGFTGFKMRFSFHREAEAPEKLPTSNASIAIFNCSVPFFTRFSQHLMCNLETECARAEDEVSCPYWQGDCPSGFLNAGSKCYKYFKTRRIMTWYDASSVCLKQGLTLASFPTSKWGESFRDSVLRYAPSTFDVFIGLRTSDSSLAAIYREVWQWSSGIMAYYVHIGRQQLFKPTCASFAALSRDKLSTTLCGFYEYMHYIFCEMDTPSTLNQSSSPLLPKELNLIFSLVNSTRLVTCPDGHIMHDFLSCDHETRCSAEPGMKSCVTYSSDSAFTNVEVLMYVCDSQTQTIHYTQVCDHRAQCFDSSDESFCVHRVCSEKQCQNEQCVTAAQWCDGMAHCSDGSDEACPQYMTVSAKPPSASVEGFRVVLFDGYGKYEYVPQGKDFSVCPFTHLMCSNRELCLPIYLRCNGIYDCAGREDEDNCGSVRCPGFYRCRQSAVCVHSDHMCDGVSQCPQQDDDLLCQPVCPDNCLCQGLAFVCPRSFPAETYTDLRYLDSSGSDLSPDKLVRNHYLIRLILSNCGLYTLPVFEFSNLKFLFLDDNILTDVKMEVFLKLSSLSILSLSGNPITMLIPSESFARLERVHSLDLSHTKLTHFENKALRNLPNLKTLNMSHGKLKVIISDTGFSILTRIESLDLRGSKLKEYPVKMLQSLPSLQAMFSDVYKMCCQDVLPEQFNSQNCHTPPDEIASCEDLLRSDIYRTFLWVSCCFALVGNIGSLAAKMHMQNGRSLSSYNVFVSHLNVADFLMGLYLAMIGSADLIYRGTYLWHDEMWKTSVACKAAGFFSLLSCEMSAFIICLITLDRVLVINFPFSQVRFRNMSAQMVCMLSWMVGLALAALPLLPVASHWEFYSQTDICIPLPVTKQDFKGHYYSFGVLILFNFILFVLIAVGQMVIYISIHVNSMDSEQKNEREFTVARRLLTIVISDFLCWFPICLFGLLASGGVSVPGEVNVAMAIFALPINSALNPFLFTFNLLMEKRQKASEKRLLKKLEMNYARISLIKEH